MLQALLLGALLGMLFDKQPESVVGHCLTVLLSPVQNFRGLHRACF